MKLRHLAIPAALSALGLREVYRYSFCAGSSRLIERLDKKTHKARFYIRKSQAMEELSARKCIRHTIRSERGEELAGFYYPCGDRPSGKIAFIIHGYRSDHADTGCMLMEHWFSRGFDIFACDHTAAGQSGGKYVGFGHFESRDCLRWLDFLIGEYGSDVKIVLHGFSMGGATVMIMSDQLPENVKFIIEDSGYSSAGWLVRSKLGWLYQPVRLLNRILAGYDVDAVDVRPHLRRARIPILFAHGSGDVTVPYDMGIALHAFYEGEKDCLFLPGVAHIEPVFTNPVEYGEKTDKFIRKYF